jgi:hypothetical protein
MKIFILLLLFVMFPGGRSYAQIYLAADGNDDNPGTIEQPYGSFAKAISAAAPGDTIYVRGGEYILTTTIIITAVKNGTEEQMYTLTAYHDEIPLLDFSGQAFGSKGISLKANYWHIMGLQIKGAGDNGMEIDFGSNNLIERCAFFENRDTGLQLSNGSANNRIINCDSYYNADPTDYGDADGFAPKLAVGTGNYFYGCRSWGNCDDGWDGYLRGATNVQTTLENCWTWGNGYLKDGRDPGPQANGNGFKMGGGDNSNSDNLTHDMLLINCLAFNNKVKGFDQNNNAGSMILYNCTGFHNLTANFRVQRTLADGESLVVKNCVSFQGAVQLGSFAVEETNSWLPPFTVTEEDFVDFDSTAAAGPRKPDGSLPDIGFMHLAEGSDLINAGVNVGLPYNGTAPDLGAFESDYSTGVRSAERIATGFTLYQNYPNPFNPVTTIRFDLAKAGNITLRIYDITGRVVETLINGRMGAGTYAVDWQAPGFASGIYLCRLTGSGLSQTRKLVLQR